MNKFIDVLFRYLAPPAFLLDIYSLIVQNLNVWLLIGVSVVSIIAGVMSIRKNKAEKAAFEAQKRLFDLQFEEIAKTDTGKAPI